jgi:hypothetical protein
MTWETSVTYLESQIYTSDVINGKITKPQRYKSYVCNFLLFITRSMHVEIGWCQQGIFEAMCVSICYCYNFFLNYTIHRRHSQRTHTNPYEYTHANPTLRSIFEDYAGKSSRLTKSPQAPRCQRERRLPLKAQTPLNPEKFAPTGSRTQDLRCYRGSCNH